MSLAAPDYTKSVTRNDYEEQPRSGGLLRMLITPWHRGGNHLDPLPDDLPRDSPSHADDGSVPEPESAPPRHPAVLPDG